MAWRWAWLLAIGCDGGGPGGGDDVADPCDPDPCANAPGTSCVDGACVDTTLSLDGAGAAFTGTWTPPAGVVVRFGATADAGVATAFLETDAARVDVTLGGDDALTLTVGGTSFDGLGDLTQPELDAVSALLTGDLAHGLGVVPAKLGCADAELDRLAVAALLAPWQAALKYGVADRTRAGLDLARASGCAYFPEMGGLPLNGLVKLDHESIVPVVYGHFPFDDVGELPVDPSVRAAGDLHGPCSARCRGACGGDCQPVNCEQIEAEICDLDVNGVNNGYAIAALRHVCGTAAGCQLHDDCYDTCNAQHGCGTWDAAFCRRGCDEEAIGIHGFENCQAWAMGLGPFDGTLSFTYPVGQDDDDPTNDDGAARLDLATCPVPPGTLVWEDPPGSGAATFADAVTWCDNLVLDGHDDWRLPSMTEIMGIERGCAENDCSAVDSCTGCAMYGGPAANGCYWDPRMKGECGGYWTSSPFIYQAGMHWIQMFFNGSAAIGHDSQTALVRCVRTGS